MRFKISLNIDKHTFGNRLPFNYQYELSAVIYKILANADQAFAEWLHDNGFVADKKIFKLFSFSRLQIPQYHTDGIFLFCPNAAHRNLFRAFSENSNLSWETGKPAFAAGCKALKCCRCRSSPNKCHSGHFRRCA